LRAYGSGIKLEGYHASAARAMIWNSKTAKNLNGAGLDMLHQLDVNRLQDYEHGSDMKDDATIVAIRLNDIVDLNH
jgi:hypothetical protein